VKVIPRKSLTEGNSPRISVRITNEIKEILENQEDKSEFIREAIIHYARFDSALSRPSTTEYTYNKANSVVSRVESTEDEDKRVVAYKPAWKR
jgi:hypothetical protein